MITRRPFSIEDLSKLWSWLNSSRDMIFDDFDPQTYAEFEIVMRNRIASELTWAIVEPEQGRVIGYVGAMRANGVTAQIKGLIVDPRERGKGAGLLGFKSVVEQLHREGYDKVMASCFSKNSVMITLFRRLKADREGMLVGVTRVKGEPTDLILWSL